MMLSHLVIPVNSTVEDGFGGKGRQRSIPFAFDSASADVTLTPEELELNNAQAIAGGVGNLGESPRQPDRGTTER